MFNLVCTKTCVNKIYKWVMNVFYKICSIRIIIKISGLIMKSNLNYFDCPSQDLLDMIQPMSCFKITQPSCIIYHREAHLLNLEEHNGDILIHGNVIKFHIKPEGELSRLGKN